MFCKYKCTIHTATSTSHEFLSNLNENRSTEVLFLLELFISRFYFFAQSFVLQVLLYILPFMGVRE